MDIRAQDGTVAPVIRTARLTLRPLRETDAGAIAAGVNNWDVAKWLAVVPHPYTIEDAYEFLHEIAPVSGLHWVIDDGAFAGIISNGRELGYWLAEDRWGRGYMTEAGRAVIAHHFADPDAGDIRSGYFVANERSGGVLTKLGFKPGEERRMYCLARGDDMDSQSMILTRARWEALQAGA